MSYIWEGYNKDNKYHSGRNLSPYMEVFSYDTTDVLINPLIRFADIYNNYDVVKGSDIINANEVENVILHFLAQLDFYSGFDVNQIYADYLCDVILDGGFGETSRKRFAVLTEERQNIILFALKDHLLYSQGDKFFWTIQRIFSGASLIYESDKETYYLYIEDDESNENIEMFFLIRDLFWDFELNLTVVWKNHYGIIDNDETMMVGMIKIV